MTNADDLAALRARLARDPADLDANLRLAKLRLDADDIWEAEMCYRRVTQLYPGVMQAWHKFARLNGGEEATVRDAQARRRAFQAGIDLEAQGQEADACGVYDAIRSNRPEHSAGWNLALLNLAPAPAPNAAIYVCCSKPYPALSDAIHRPIHVGAALPGESIGLPGDDTGDNISAKNRGYCELTGHYWAWKNDRGSDLVGLAHYRRLFLFSSIRDATISRFARKPIPVEGLGSDYVHAGTAAALIGTADVILPQPWRFSVPLEQQFISSARAEGAADHAELWRLMIAALGAHHRPVLDGGQAALEGGHGYFFNMFLMRRPWFAAYSDMLFDVLERVEDAARAKGIAAVEQRGMGFLAERIMAIYAGYLRRDGRARIREVPVVHLVGA